SHVAIRLHGKDYINIDKDDRLGYVRAKVEIGEYTFIGAGACVLPGVTIGKGSLISAGAVVSKSVPPYSIVAGNPAKVIGSTINMDSKYFSDPLVRKSYFDPGVLVRDSLNNPTNERGLS
ncbi:MAG: acyltransferase, partial [Rhodocyclaceae bacterium]